MSIAVLLKGTVRSLLSVEYRYYNHYRINSDIDNNEKTSKLLLILVNFVCLESNFGLVDVNWWSEEVIDSQILILKFL